MVATPNHSVTAQVEIDGLGLGEIYKMGTRAVPTGPKVANQYTPPTSSPAPISTHAPPAARSCALASRFAWFPDHITALHRFGGLGMPISASGAAAPHARPAEVLGECFASVDQCAGAQVWFDTARWRIVLDSLLQSA